MSKIKRTAEQKKHDDLFEEARHHCYYIKATSRTIGVYNDPVDMSLANNSASIKKLIKSHGYRIQMLIK